MNDDTVDEIGIRNTPSNLVFTNGQTSRWIGSGILNKPIGDFFPTLSHQAKYHNGQTGPYFANSIRMGIHSRAIPEPEGYMLIAGFIALFIVVLKNAYEKRNWK